MSSPATLRLWLSGPLQSWGTSSRFEVRSTDLFPSKSGVVGLVAAALGRGRTVPVDDLGSCRFGVRVVQAGRVRRDFHTVGAGDGAGVAVASGSGRRGIVTERFYLEDAAFIVGLESPDGELLAQIERAVLDPFWPLALGRRSCPPGDPVVLPGALVHAPLAAALSRAWEVPPRRMISALEAGAADFGAPDAVQLILEDDDGAVEVHDQPVGAAFSTRRFVSRRVRHTFMVPVGDA